MATASDRYLSIAAMSKAELVDSVIISNQTYHPGVYLIWFKAPFVAETCRPGQFVMIRCGDNLLRRPFSIHRVSKDEGEIALLFSVMGKGTSWLAERHSGESIDMLGPLGSLCELVPGDPCGLGVRDEGTGVGEASDQAEA